MSDTRFPFDRSLTVPEPRPHPPVILAPEVSAADVRIEDLQVHSHRDGAMRVRHEIAVEVASDNDDDARNVRCVVVLPPTANLLDTDPPASVGPTFPAVGDPGAAVQSAPSTGFVVFELPSPLGVGQHVALHLSASVQISYAQVPIAAFVYSDCPDPNPANNFRSVVPPVPVGH
ncbi:MAG: hypothetical protein QM582_01860 [Micropruina sp.]|uniref:hypothetical protein n=1 Tax=Micropruina sp. TaxID=2737536 RepID=UPI0039E6AC89